MVKFVAVGDVGMERDNPEVLFDAVRDRLSSADVGFAQLEVNLTTRGERLPQARHTVRGHVSTADALVGAGLSIVSFCGNHTMDWGATGMRDTLAHLRRAGAQPVGAGETIDEARAPVIAEAKGHRIGVLAVNSILPQDYWAEPNRPGCAPMRGHTRYEQIEHDQPGTPARIHTWPHRGDLRALTDSIETLRPQVDTLILSHHAGIHFTRAEIPDYQRDVAFAAIDAGADMVIGTHAHILKGMEFHKGKPILHSLANFAIELTMTKEHAEGRGFQEIKKLSPGWEADLTSRYNFPPDSRMTLIAEAGLGPDGPDLRLVPVWIGRDAVPRIVGPDDERFEQILTYMRDITAEAGLTTRYEADGDTIRPVP